MLELRLLNIKTSNTIFKRLSHFISPHRKIHHIFVSLLLLSELDKCTAERYLKMQKLETNTIVLCWRICQMYFCNCYLNFQISISSKEPPVWPQKHSDFHRLTNLSWEFSYNPSKNIKHFHFVVRNDSHYSVFWLSRSLKTKQNQTNYKWKKNEIIYCFVMGWV